MKYYKIEIVYFKDGNDDDNEIIITNSQRVIQNLIKQEIDEFAHLKIEIYKP